MHKVVLSLGTNIGNKEENLHKALYYLSHSGIRVLKVSKKLISSPWGNWHQPNFMNIVIIAETSIAPADLLKTIKEIEKNMGRTKGHMEPRVIDIDIIFYDDTIVKEEALEIPHPSFRERGFVLEPLMEIAPDIKDPVTEKTIKELYQEFLKMPFVASVNTPIGDFFVAVKENKIIKTSFHEIKGRKEYIPLLDKLLKKLERYFSGEPIEFKEYRIDLSTVPPSYRHIYNVLRKIPYGVTISYSQLAELSGISKGARLVGNAMKQNPFPIIIPCHRVVRKNGRIGGFSAGIDKKIFLLKLELKDNFFKIFPKCTH